MQIFCVQIWFVQLTRFPQSGPKRVTPCPKSSISTFSQGIHALSESPKWYSWGFYEATVDRTIQVFARKLCSAHFGLKVEIPDPFEDGNCHLSFGKTNMQSKWALHNSLISEIPDTLDGHNCHLSLDKKTCRATGRYITSESHAFEYNLVQIPPVEMDYTANELVRNMHPSLLRIWFMFPWLYVRSSIYEG